jgi:hypothetical protein
MFNTLRPSTFYSSAINRKQQMSFHFTSVTWRKVTMSIVTGKEVQLFLDAFAKLRKAAIRFLVSVCPSSCNNSAVTGRIFIKFDI